MLCAVSRLCIFNSIYIYSLRATQYSPVIIQQSRIYQQQQAYVVHDYNGLFILNSNFNLYLLAALAQQLQLLILYVFGTRIGSCSCQGGRPTS